MLQLFTIICFIPVMLILCFTAVFAFGDIIIQGTERTIVSFFSDKDKFYTETLQNLKRPQNT